MAGRGRRFKDAGFRVPKPMIDVDGKPMIQRVIENLTPDRIDYRFIFIYLKEQEDFILPTLQKYGGITIPVNETTVGSTSTVLHAREYIDNSNPVIIAACDQIIDFDINDFLMFVEGLDGCLLTYKSSNPHHSYSRLEDDSVVETAEKKVISDNANVGIYYFGSGKEFCKAAEMELHKKDNYKDEYYIAPVYNYLENRNIKIYEVKESDCHILGTPVELRLYLERIR
jgi:NDP-sugar pyrophosphorylase family protein